MVITGNETGSDCRIKAELKKSGGRAIHLNSKVEALYGKQILRKVNEQLDFYGIEHVSLDIHDEGALEFVMAARLEAAMKQLKPSIKEYVPEIIAQNKYHTEKNRPRRSRLYLPGNSPKLMLNAGIHKPDGLILDLEDAVAPAKKQEARYMVRNTLASLDLLGAERMVRINQLPMGLDDLNFCVPYNVNLILLPKCESADQIRQVENKIIEIQKLNNITEPVWLMPIIESALGVIKAFEIASASEHVVALAIGLEDYTADLGTLRTNGGQESFYARSALVNAAKAAGIQAIDSVFSDVGDMEALAANVQVSKSLGFDGMGCIHPRQIKVIHDGYAPEDKEVKKARAICFAFFEAEKKGLGVVSLGSKMIDAPVVKRALHTMDMAVQAGKISANWREEE
ncbi:MAG: citrate lyase ACP [Candidatus Marinimicrobia bacterium]|nr:citrate lyase ACP [Candidatus Neomarinimicrobiota bacterium]